MFALMQSKTRGANAYIRDLGKRCARDGEKTRARRPNKSTYTIDKSDTAVYNDY